MKTIKLHKTLVPAIAGLTLIAICGCSGEQWRQAGREAASNYQCQQESANRPDSAQRQAECDHRTRQQTREKGH